MSQIQYRGDAAQVEVFGRKLAAKRWGNSDGEPVLMLHGWLDNANSFDRLAPQLPELNIVAMDFAGHGLSDYRAAGSHYYHIDDVQDALAMADALGWEQFSVIGHSMGAQVSSELTALFPQRVKRAFFIDGFMATGGVSMAERVEQTREALTRMLAPAASQARVFDSLAAMAQRVTQATDQSLAAAEVLVARGHKQVAGGYTWRTDPRIRYPSPLRAGRDYLNELLRDCQVPSMLLVAEQGDSWYQGEVELSQSIHPALQVVRMPGPHHIHLEPEHVATVVQYVRGFFQLSPGAAKPRPLAC